MKKRSSSSQARANRAVSARRTSKLPASRSRTRKSARSVKPGTIQIGRSAKLTIDHKEIQRWVEARNGSPAVVKRTHRTGEAEGILRIDFPGFSGAKTLDHVS